MGKIGRLLFIAQELIKKPNVPGLLYGIDRSHEPALAFSALLAR